MQLENQVSSREPSMRLKELGVKQESLFYWTKVSRASDEQEFKLTLGNQINREMCSAFTVAELGEMLPVDIRSYKSTNWEGDWVCLEIKGLRMEIEKTEADARAKMIIHLIENKLITLN